jgi:hypothetical protein
MPKRTAKPQTESAPRKTVSTVEIAANDESPAAMSLPWMNHATEKAVNEHELTSLTALIMYVAHTTRQHEHRVERQFADRFNIPNVRCLASEHYDAAIRYLVDQVPAEATAG